MPVTQIKPKVGKERDVPKTLTRARAVSQLIDESGSFTAFMGGFTTFLLLSFFRAS